MRWRRRFSFSSNQQRKRRLWLQYHGHRWQLSECRGGGSQRQWQTGCDHLELQRWDGDGTDEYFCFSSPDFDPKAGHQSSRQWSAGGVAFSFARLVVATEYGFADTKLAAQRLWRLWHHRRRNEQEPHHATDSWKFILPPVASLKRWKQHICHPKPDVLRQADTTSPPPQPAVNGEFGWKG